MERNKIRLRTGDNGGESGRKRRERPRKVVRQRLVVASFIFFFFFFFFFKRSSICVGAKFSTLSSIQTGSCFVVYYCPMPLSKAPYSPNICSLAFSSCQVIQIPNPVSTHFIQILRLYLGPINHHQCPDHRREQNLAISSYLLIPPTIAHAEMSSWFMIAVLFNHTPRTLAITGGNSCAYAHPGAQ
ncbi:unnamed protein product [Pleuronectes platessa]|uniref:Uncharacterized protein n=1 Tax=Pleuronectes platessa TaxID=8262 RepID=A0A9N7Y8B7_PLEPL|nr:unnamed protein product [Pleuronectes platessa]